MTWYSKKSKKGAVLIAVLGLVFLISIIVTQFLSLAFAEIKRLSLYAERDNLKVATYSNLEIALAVLAELKILDNGLFGPGQQGWTNVLQYAQIEPEDGITTSITITDETGKIPLSPSTSEELLSAFFENMGFSSSDSTTLTDSLLDWIDEDDDQRLSGAESDTYEQKNPSYKAANAPLVDFTQLRYIQGFDTLFFDQETDQPNENYQNFTKNVSLYNLQNTPINLNTASKEVLNALSTLTNISAEDVLSKRDGEDGTSNTEDDKVLKSDTDLGLTERPSQNTSRLYGYNASILKIEILTKEGANTYLLTAIVQVNSSQNPSSSNPETNSESRQRGDSQPGGLSILKISENKRIPTGMPTTSQSEDKD